MKLEEVATQLGQRVAHTYNKLEKHRLIVAMAGGPGSGKSTLASKIHDVLAQEHHLTCQAIELDGFQYSKAQLDKMDNPQRAHECRGCVWTFDAHGVVNFVRKVKEQGEGKLPKDEKVQAPHFDEEACDPIPNGEVVDPSTQIIIFEGVYFLSRTEPWVQVQDLVDERWMVHVDQEISRKRVAERRHKKGIEKDLDKSYEKYDASDGKNNIFIIENRGPVDWIIENNEEWGFHEPDHKKERERERQTDRRP